MNVLIAYAGWLGSTKEIADDIGRTLVAQEGTVDVRPAQQVASLQGYDAVVLGAAVRYGKLHPDMTAFVERQRAELAQLPAACFVVCGFAASPAEDKQREAAAYLEPLRAALAPVSTAVFAGASLRERTPLLERLMLWWVSAPYGDFRDWNAIRTWAASLPTAFQAGEAAAS